MLAGEAYDYSKQISNWQVSYASRISTTGIIRRRAGCIFLRLLFLSVPILTHYTSLNIAKGAVPFIPYRVPAEEKMLLNNYLIKLEELNTMDFTEAQQSLAIKNTFGKQNDKKPI